MRIALIVSMLTMLSSCVVYDTWSRCETLRKGEVRFQFPPDEIAQENKIKRESLPAKCAKFMRVYDDADWDEETETYPYNREWNECMGVGLK